MNMVMGNDVDYVSTSTMTAKIKLIPKIPRKVSSSDLNNGITFAL